MTGTGPSEHPGHGPPDHQHEQGHGVAGADAGHGNRSHDHRGGLPGLLRSFLVPHSHDAAESVDQALTASSEGIRAVKISLGALLVTAALQVVVVVVSGSVALLGDTIHNFADALTAVPWRWRSGSAVAGPTAATPTATAVPKTSPASSSWS